MGTKLYITSEYNTSSNEVFESYFNFTLFRPSNLNLRYHSSVQPFSILCDTVVLFEINDNMKDTIYDEDINHLYYF